MSLHYILDGHNITKQVSAFSFKNLKEGRDSLSSLIEIYHPQGSIKNQVTIVFDGQDNIFYDTQKFGNLRVIFSVNQSAEDKIISLVTQSNNKSQMIVVSDDKALKFTVRALGAKVLSVAEFLGKTAPPAAKTSGKDASKEDEKHISKTLEHKITSEMEKIWLKK